MRRRHQFWDKSFRTLESFCKLLSSAERSVGESTQCGCSSRDFCGVCGTRSLFSAGYWSLPITLSLCINPEKGGGSDRTSYPGPLLCGLQAKSITCVLVPVVTLQTDALCSLPLEQWQGLERMFL